MAAELTRQEQRLIIDKRGIPDANMLVAFLSLFLLIWATCWFGKHQTSVTLLTVPELYDAKANIIVLWKRNEPVLKEASIFDGVRQACSVVDALTAVVRGHSGGDFQGQWGMWYSVQHEDRHVGKSKYGRKS